MGERESSPPRPSPLRSHNPETTEGKGRSPAAIRALGKTPYSWGTRTEFPNANLGQKQGHILRRDLPTTGEDRTREMGTTSKPKKAAGLEPQLPEKTEQSLQEVQAGKKIPSGSSRADIQSTPPETSLCGEQGP